MNIASIKTLLQNKITSLEWQRQTNIELWNIDSVLAIESEILETQNTLNELK